MRDLLSDFEWIKAHAHGYYGQYLALFDGQLLAHGMDRKQVSAEAHQKVDSDQILIFHAVGYPR